MIGVSGVANSIAVAATAAVALIVLNAVIVLLLTHRQTYSPWSQDRLQ